MAVGVYLERTERRMAFNSNTYRANKAAKAAWSKLSEARELRARIQAGQASDWEIPRLPFLVQRACWEMKNSIFYRQMRALEQRP